MSYISGASWCRRKSWIKYYKTFHSQFKNNCLDITILLAMVVFMDQLTQQTPPVADKLPVIGQVNMLVGEVVKWIIFTKRISLLMI